ncbi:hypothetical protein PG994_013526 [Apiospora phragmitis]|uniref:Uncharacterized protein n=1 Tax=Apiospora phragmitis TaxID=2905665 RepID=A0ABR1T8Z3_9PEZI
MQVRASDNPGFSTGCETSCKSPTNELVGCGPQRSGAYSLSTAMDGDDAVVVTLKSRKAMAEFTVRLDDMTRVDGTVDTGAMTTWTYKDDANIVVPTRDLEVSRDDPAWIVPSGVEWDLASATASVIATAALAAGTTKSSSSVASVTASPTAAESEPSATEAETSASASPSDEPSSATRGSAFAGVIFAIGLMALVL